MSPDEVDFFLDVLLAHLAKRKPVYTLRLQAMPRADWIKYQQHQASGAHSRYAYDASLPAHGPVIRQAAAVAALFGIAQKFERALLTAVRQDELVDLEFGWVLPPGLLRQLADALPPLRRLKRLAFSGSHLGDGGFEVLCPRLVENASIEDLELSSCSLTDVSALRVSAMILSHARRYEFTAWAGLLRAYPNASLTPNAARRQYHSELCGIAADVDRSAGGLLQLDLSHNGLTDAAVSALTESLRVDKRLMFVNLRCNRLTQACEAGLASVMQELKALLCVDLRRNPDPECGLLRLHLPNTAPPAATPYGMVDVLPPPPPKPEPLPGRRRPKTAGDGSAAARGGGGGSAPRRAGTAAPKAAPQLQQPPSTPGGAAAPLVVARLPNDGSSVARGAASDEGVGAPDTPASVSKTREPDGGLERQAAGRKNAATSPTAPRAPFVVSTTPLRPKRRRPSRAELIALAPRPATARGLASSDSGGAKHPRPAARPSSAPAAPGSASKCAHPSVRAVVELAQQQKLDSARKARRKGPLYQATSQGGTSGSGDSGSTIQELGAVLLKAKGMLESLEAAAPAGRRDAPAPASRPAAAAASDSSAAAQRPAVVESILRQLDELC